MTFRTRTFLVLMSLVVLVECATFVAVLSTTRADFIRQGQRELQLGRLIVDNALESRSRELAIGVGVLAGDFGFKRAAAIGDEATIRSALINHGNRINADLTLLVDPDGKVRASSAPLTSQPVGSEFPLTEGLRAIDAYDAPRRHLLAIDGMPMQIVLAPVRAPDLIGWVVVGFAVDDALAQHVRSLTHLDVTFVDASGSGQVVASTLPAGLRGALPGQLPATGANDPAVVTAAGKELLSLRHTLSDDSGYALDVLLGSDMEEILSGYGPLRLRLSVILVLALCLSALGARLLAQTVARPLRRFATAARRISRGDYREPVDAVSNDEIGMLANAFNNMQRGIEKREDQIVYQSQHDALTGLPNRSMVTERLEHAVYRSLRTGEPFAVMLLDLDGFKDINDTLGHETGDRVLQEVASRLARQCRDNDIVARLGGDEFVLLLEDSDHVGAMRSATRLMDHLGESISVQSMQIRTRASIGIAGFPEHGDTAEQILRRADIAMYTAKDSDVRIAVYESGQDENHLRRLEMVNDLRQALEEEQLYLEYQPKLDLRTGRVTAVEALVRWPHPRHGKISPEEFVPLAEQSGHIRTLTHQVLVMALSQLQHWHSDGMNIGVSINLSALDLLDQQLPDIVAGLLSRYALDGAALTLEITESAVMKDTAYARGVMERLRAQGIKLSIDDFGTGHASLAQLKHLPVDELKIDKSFVLELADNEDDAAIVRSTIEMGHNMGLTVTAEGVETDLSQTMLLAYRCDLIQGFLLSKPLSGDDFSTWLKSRDEEAPGKRAANDAVDEGAPLAPPLPS